MDIGSEVTIDSNTSESTIEPAYDATTDSDPAYETDLNDVLTTSKSSFVSHGSKINLNKNPFMKERILDQMEKTFQAIASEKESDAIDHYCESLKPSLRMLSPHELLYVQAEISKILADAIKPKYE